MVKKYLSVLLLAGICSVGFGQIKPAANKIKTVTIYTSAEKTTLRLSGNGSVEFKKFTQPLETDNCIFIDPSGTFQTFMGIGGALTDAAAETFYKLPKAAQQEFLTACYDSRNGIGYVMGRTNMSSCDFSSDIYSYINDYDSTLSSFSVAHDEKYKMPFIKEIMAKTAGKLKLFLSPWSPPGWMKDNNDPLHGGKLKPQFNQAWANYYVKFIKAYEAAGIPMWGLTIQNEPMAKQRWESCIYTAEEERDFVKNFLGPTLQKQKLGDKKIIVWDHNRDLMYQRASVILNDKDAAKYVWGVGFHWYETWIGGPMQFKNEKLVAQAFPSKNLIFTEGCKEKFNMDSINNWSLGEKYGYSMINDFNNGTVAWTDWNVLLDEQGGPNHVNNFCFSPIHADTRNGKLIYTNAYYYIGHFSKFIKPGAKRIAASANRDQLQTTAFQNPDGSIAVVVMNSTDKGLTYYLCIKGKAATVESLPHSINTLIIQ